MPHLLILVSRSVKLCTEEEENRVILSEKLFIVCPVQPLTSSVYLGVLSGLLQESVLIFIPVRTISVGLGWAGGGGDKNPRKGKFLELRRAFPSEANALP